MACRGLQPVGSDVLACRRRPALRAGARKPEQRSGRANDRALPGLHGQPKGDLRWTSTPQPDPRARSTTVWSACRGHSKRFTTSPRRTRGSACDTVMYETANYCFPRLKTNLLNDSTDFRPGTWLLMDKDGERLSRFRTAP